MSRPAVLVVLYLALTGCTLTTAAVVGAVVTYYPVVDDIANYVLSDPLNGAEEEHEELVP